MLRRRVPFVSQMEAAECGAACLAMVLGYYRRHLPLMEARAACGAGRDGANAQAILAAARGQGLLARAVQVDAHDLGSIDAPAILHWQFRHFVVLERMHHDGADIVDPALGPRRVSLRELDESFTGIAFVLSPGPSFRRLAKALPALARYRRGIARALPALLLVFGTSVIMELLSIVLPGANQVLIDVVIRPRQSRWLYALAAVLAGTAITSMLTTWTRGRVLNAFQSALDLDLAGGFAAHLLALPLAFFELRSPGDLLSRVQSASIVRELANTCVSAFLDAALLVGYGALMLGYDVRLGGAVLGLAVVRMLLSWWARSRAASSTVAEIAASAREQSVVVEALSTFESTKAFGIERLLTRRHRARLVERLNAMNDRRAVTQEGSQWLSLFDGVTSAAVLYVGGARVVHEQMSLGTFCAFLTLQGLVAKPLQSLLGVVLQWPLIETQLRRLDDVLDAEVEPNGNGDPGVLQGAIQFDDVTFRYAKDGPDVLRGFRLHVAPGEKVAIVGPSGAGKSTIGRLLLGFVRPSSGRVAIDGVDLRALDVGLVRRQIGSVLQEPFVLDDSAEANIVMQRDVAPGEARVAARLAEIDHVLGALPEGYDTRLGPRGSRLSGGERQRLAIARALAGSPSICLFDEATSALDAENERLVHDRLRRLGATQIVIAHRLATVRDADRIVVVEGGTIVQEGTFDELRARPGLFQRMAATLS